MSIVKRIIDEINQTCLKKVQRSMETDLQQIRTDVLNNLKSPDNTSRIAGIQQSMGKFADDVYMQIVEEAVAACLSNFSKFVLNEGHSYHECLRACYRQLKLKCDATSAERCHDEMQATVHILEKEVEDRDKTICEKEQDILGLKVSSRHSSNEIWCSMSRLRTNHDCVVCACRISSEQRETTMLSLSEFCQPRKSAK